MYTLSENLPHKEMKAFDGMGTILSTILTDKEGLYGHGRLFNHSIINPGCSIGYHVHNHETEFYYIRKGEAVFNDDGKEVILHAGDIGITGYGQGHALENRSNEPVEMIALIIME